jgi:hypothetical protein
MASASSKCGRRPTTCVHIFSSRFGVPEYNGIGVFSHPRLGSLLLASGDLPGSIRPDEIRLTHLRPDSPDKRLLPSDHWNRNAATHVELPLVDDDWSSVKMTR